MKPITNTELLLHVASRPWYSETASAYVEARARAFGLALDTLDRECLRCHREAAGLLESRGPNLAKPDLDLRAVARAGKRALDLRHRVKTLLDDFERGPQRYLVPTGAVLDGADAQCRDLLDFHMARYEEGVRFRLQQCAGCLERFADACAEHIKGDNDHA